MELNQERLNSAETSKKHSISTESDTDIHNSQTAKKVKLFSAKEFRKNLHGDNKVIALKQFLNAINESNGHDYVMEYLEKGGNCLELLQILELDSTLSPVLVFELVAHVLLKITASAPQYHGPAYESCRYMLNNYITVINKMLSLSSKNQERRICLKLLSAIVTFSSSLAKDVLLHVNFHSANIELLTKNTGEENSVRDYFIHFLTAFLVDGYYPSLSVLLDKKGFITSIIKGLQFDVVDTVCVVISAMKNHILENNSVSKTSKMKIFNTLVVRDIVNLYNWKGPAALKSLGKNRSDTMAVHEYSKSKVNECVHDFLLVLCTSHKYGVIFRDHSLGLGKKHQNALMYTVLESLDRPWEHSYACELVTKICEACPDLTKTMWLNLKSFLEPRLTQKWLNAMQFAKGLLRHLMPSCIEFCAREFNINQLSQVIQILVAPLPILKVIIPENGIFENTAVKRHIISLLLEMLSSLNSYVEAAKEWLSTEHHRKLNILISSYVTKNFLDANIILNDWETGDRIDDVEESGTISQEQHLETVFNIFDFYIKLAPQLLENLHSSNFQLTDFLLQLSARCTNEIVCGQLQVKMINIFIDLEPGDFSINSEHFSYIVPLLFKIYYHTTDLSALNVLNKILRHTGIFDGCTDQINIWINGILNLKHFDDYVVQSFIQILETTASNIMEFSEELSALNIGTDVYGNTDKIFEKLKNTDVTFDDDAVIVKQKYLSPIILGLMNYLKDATLTKGLKSYSNFVLLNLIHCQTQMEILTKFVQKYETVPKAIKEYVLSWTESKEITFLNFKGRIDVFQMFSEALLYGNIEKKLKIINLTQYHDLPLNLLQASIFYIVNLANDYAVIEKTFENCFIFINHLIKIKLFYTSHTETVLTHPVLLSHFSMLHLESNLYTKFSLDVITLLLDSKMDISRYLQIYRGKLLKAILKIIKKPAKCTPNFIKVLQLFGLSFEQYYRVLTTFSHFSELDNQSVLPLDILSYSLQQFASLYETEKDRNPLEETIIENLTTYFVALNERQDINVLLLSAAFHKYFQTFPHHIKHVNPKLLLSLVSLNDYGKENVSLAVFLLERNIHYFKTIRDNIDNLCNRKGILLPVLDVLIQENVEEDILEEIFQQFEASLTKVLVKPQKAGQHFQNNYKGLIVLLEKFMPLEKCRTFTNKVQKFETAEVFHVKLLETLFIKVINDEVTVNQVNNIILTFVHLQMHVFKRNTKISENTPDFSKLEDIADSFNNILTKLSSKVVNMDLKATAKNESLRQNIVCCLKFGISGQPVLLKSVTNIIKILADSMEKDYGKLVLDMLLSHSKFLDTVLDEHNPTKLEILSLFLTLCRIWTDFMERHHVPVLLAAYRAMVNGCDTIIWTLLKMYEANAGQTNFHDFKPFLWGRAAASHYSVRQNSENSLWRQPKMRDILDILQEELIISTIVNCPLKEVFQLNGNDIKEIENCKSYDFKFLLPLFSLILAPEAQVQTYAFTRSGALSLTILALSHEEQKIREAACHVLSRFYFHVDANQHGKDNPLWLRYVEVICKGISVLPEKKLNNFSAIYLARMALILTQPNHVMYIPLGKHLTAKSSLDFSTIPELYTFLHSSDINYKDHRIFILELLKDGLKTEKDFKDFLRSMAFKLFSELYNSSLADIDTKLLILDVIRAACKIPLGVKMLCENHSLLIQLFNSVNNVLTLPYKVKQEMKGCVSKIILILLEISRALQDYNSCFAVFNLVLNVVKDDVFSVLSEIDQEFTFEVLYLVCRQHRELITNEVIDVLLEKTNNKFCKYVKKYGCEFVDVKNLSSNDKCYYLKLLIVDKIKA